MKEVERLLSILDRHTVELGWGEKPITLAELVVARDGNEELDACRAAMLENTPQAASQLAPSVDNGNMQNTPAGFKLVPEKPTREMIDAGKQRALVDDIMENDMFFVLQIYRAMLAAAPTPTKAVND